MTPRLGLSAGCVAMIAALALAVPFLDLYNPVAIDVAHRMAGPSAAHWLGQDEFGRDVLSRLLWGARVSLAVAVGSAALAGVLGTALGLAGGFLGGWVELATIRGMDVVLCFPPLLLALLVVTIAGPGAGTLIPVLALVYLPGFTRQVYAGVLEVRARPYVEAMRVLGAGRLRIVLGTILPNVGGPVLVQFSLAVAAGMVLESGLSFLGLGVVPPAPSWGLMIGAARSTMSQAPLLLLWPCIALSLAILAVNALCDALRDTFDPRHVARLSWRRGVSAPPSAPLPGPGPVLAVRGLTVEIATPGGTIQPVRDLSFSVAAGQTLAVVGESGSGKSLSGLAVMGLLPGAARVAAGSAWLDGQDVLRLGESALRRLRGKRMAMVFQDALGSLNPVHRLGNQLAEGIRAHSRDSRRAARARGIELLRGVGIPDPRLRARAWPHQLSGGMAQRAMIAMAVANTPRLLIADEPTTALDVTIQAQILALLADLARDQAMALMFITHNLPVVAEIADQVIVMYAGEIVEQAPAAALFARPLHPYTAALLASAPPPDGSLPRGIPGAVPPPDARPAGCAFAPRCAMRIAACEAAHPALLDTDGGRATRCLRWRDMPAS